eukprot:TRINITY_DN21547_c0_g1_i1.p2 TRINITY_DN21547_c0_g1~~TRINITY_DN21547_c0_g1_i1.p2  ORF type:complete len:143 (+),score=51.78 TRINITY_DN21547_c0_g1_i1:196-624(+)
MAQEQSDGSQPEQLSAPPLDVITQLDDQVMFLTQQLFDNIGCLQRDGGDNPLAQGQQPSEEAVSDAQGRAENVVETVKLIDELIGRLPPPVDKQELKQKMSKLEQERRGNIQQMESLVVVAEEMREQVRAAMLEISNDRLNM